MAVKSTLSKWATQQSTVTDRIEDVMTGVILTRATMLAPVLTGALVNDGRVEKNPEGGRSVVFGSNSVPYARRRHFENNLHPQTLYYLQRAGESVAKENIKKYVDMSEL